MEDDDFSSSDIRFYYFTIVVGRLVVRFIGRRMSHLFRQRNKLLRLHLRTGGEGGAEVVVERRGRRDGGLDNGGDSSRFSA